MKLLVASSSVNELTAALETVIAELRRLRVDLFACLKRQDEPQAELSTLAAIRV
jgi:hypothetical protein